MNNGVQQDLLRCVRVDQDLAVGSVRVITQPAGYTPSLGDPWLPPFEDIGVTPEYSRLHATKYALLRFHVGRLLGVVEACQLRGWTFQQ